MAFLPSYKRDIRERPPLESTILPFFGYFHHIDYDTHYDKYGGEVYLSRQNNGDYVVKRDPVIYGSAQYRYNYESFERNIQPSGKALELENRIEELLDEKELKIWDTKFICRSAREYYRDHFSWGFAKFFRNFMLVLKILCPLLGVAGIVAFILFQQTGESPISNFLPSIAFASSVILFIISFNLFIHDFDIKKPYEKCKPKVRGMNVKAYFQSMRDAYGDEIGALLQEYAILQGYDKN